MEFHALAFTPLPPPGKGPKPATLLSRPFRRLEKVQNQLLERGVECEAYGGDVAGFPEVLAVRVGAAFTMASAHSFPLKTAPSIEAR